MVRKTVSRISTVIIVIFFGAAVLLAISSRMSGGAPNILGYQILEVLSGSMEPHIHTGSVIAIASGVDPAHLQAGDVITYRSVEDANMLITHRIMNVRNSSGNLEFITQGDANDGADTSPVPADHVVGQYVNITVPYLGYFINFEKSKIGIICTLIIPGILLALWHVIGLFRTILRLEDTDAKKTELHVHDQSSTV